MLRIISFKNLSCTSRLYERFFYLFLFAEYIVYTYTYHMTFTHWLVSALAIIIASYLIPGVAVTLVGALVLAVVLGLINLFIKPLIFILTLPITIVTLGLFSLVINALMILLAAKIVPDFTVSGFWPAFWFSFVLSLINTLFHKGNEITFPTA